MKIEDKHSEILKILEENARLSDKEIATLAGLKESEVKSIIGELESRG